MEHENKAMEICASQVREIACKKCFLYERCKANGGVPVPIFGAYLARLNLTFLPRIANELNRNAARGVKLEAHAPDDGEIEKGAYAVIRCYRNCTMRSLLFRVFVQGDETEEELKTILFNAYTRAKKGRYFL